MRPVLLVGGAPRLAVDAVRYISVRATGTTAMALRLRLVSLGVTSDLLLGSMSSCEVSARRFVDRTDLDAELQAWIDLHPDGVVVMSAAVNDYRVASVELAIDDDVRHFPPGAKIPSGGDEMVIRLRPVDKIIDRLRTWGLTGPIVGFKYEARDTVLAAARSLRERTGAALVVANSLCGTVQALVAADETETFASRELLLDRLAQRLALLAGTRSATHGG